MTPITSTTANFADRLPGLPLLSEQAQFGRAMTHAAGSLAVPVPPAMGVERATTQTSPLGASVLEAISETYRGHSAPLDHRVGLLEGVRPGPPQKLPAEGDARTGTLGGVFETMIAGLRDLHYGVTRVALLSKGVSGITSSVNKLLKEG